jgi:hypothetical protein
MGSGLQESGLTVRAPDRHQNEWLPYRWRVPGEAVQVSDDDLVGRPAGEIRV